MGQGQSKSQAHSTTAFKDDAQLAVASIGSKAATNLPDHATVAISKKRPFGEAREAATRDVKRVRHVFQTPAQQLLPATAPEPVRIERRRKRTHRLEEINTEQSTPSKKPKLASGDSVIRDSVPSVSCTFAVPGHHAQPEPQSETLLVVAATDGTHTRRGSAASSSWARPAAEAEQHVEKQHVDELPVKQAGKPMRIGPRAATSAQLRSPPKLPPVNEIKWPTIVDPHGELSWPLTNTKASESANTIPGTHGTRRDGVDKPVSLPSSREVRRSVGRSAVPVVVAGSRARAQWNSTAARPVQLPPLAGPRRNVSRPLKLTKSGAYQ